jgi:hypothetical protein
MKGYFPKLPCLLSVNNFKLVKYSIISVKPDIDAPGYFV